MPRAAVSELVLELLSMDPMVLVPGRSLELVPERHLMDLSPELAQESLSMNYRLELVL